jgi:exopolyphosphatase/guanosine-5'-triphosphate,3'-diphosphate pyrophosphatase
MKTPGQADRLAALDLGTNSILVLVMRREADGRLVEELEPCRITRLGENVNRTGELGAAPMARTLQAVEELLGHIPADTHGLGVAAATSAARDARNGETFLAACTTLIGGRPHLFSGQEEALTVFGGAVSDQAPDTYCVCLDIGGGSSEIAAGMPARCEQQSSLNLGCVRLAERFGLFSAASSATIREAAAAAAALIRPACEAIRPRLHAGGSATLLASGGTAATVATVLNQIVPFDRRRVHGVTLSLTAVSDWTERLLAMTAEQRLAVPGMPIDRAPVLPAGILILREFMRALGSDTVTVTTRGLRYGLVLRLNAGELAPTWQW